MSKTTIYLDPQVRKALKLRAAESDQTISAYVNRAVAEAIAEDLEDIHVLKERKGDPTETYAEFMAHLKADGLI